MRRSKEEAAETRKRILGAALEVFRRDGIAGGTLVEVARTAGVTRGAVYHHFEDKLSLLRALMDSAYSGLDARIRDRWSKGGSPASMLRGISRDFLLALVDDPEYLAFEQILMFKRGAAPEEVPLAEMQNRTLGEVIELLAHLIREGQRAGELREDLDARFAAKAMISYLDGVECLWIFDNELFRLKDEAEDLVEFVMASLEAKPSEETAV